MAVYIEYVFIDNVIITYIILKLTTKILKFDVKSLIFILVSIFSAFCTIIFPLLQLSILLSVIFKLFLGFLICCLINNFKCPQKIINSFILFITITFIFGGMIYALFDLCSLDYNINNIVLLGFEIPVSVIIVPIFIYYKLLVMFVVYIKKKNKIESFNYIMEFGFGNSFITLKCMLDSGNNLIDPKTNCPVSIISIKKMIELNSFILKNSNLNCGVLNNLHYINVKTINGADNMMVFEVGNVKIIKENKEQLKLSRAIIGVANETFGDYDCLLNAQLI